MGYGSAVLANPIPHARNPFFNLSNMSKLCLDRSARALGRALRTDTDWSGENVKAKSHLDIGGSPRECEPDPVLQIRVRGFRVQGLGSRV